MEETSDARGYEKLCKRRGHDLDNRSSFANISPPIDAYNAVYVAFIMGGAGFLLPYNSFIMAMDYFKNRYPSTPVVFDISLVYISVAFFTVLLNNLLVETFSLNSRINFGYSISFITLVYVVVCEVGWELFGKFTSYAINLAAVAIVAIGCTIQQSSFYGYTSMLPPKYTQAVMVGESASGVFTSTVRVLTKFLIRDLRGSTIYFFSVSVTAVATCVTTYHLIRRTDFIQFYIALCERAKTRITLEPTEDAGLIETNDSQYGVLKIQTSPPATATLSFANPAYEPSAPVPTYKVEDVVIRGRHSVSSGVGLSSIKRGLLARWEITKRIYPYMISICLAYFATLCLYPGVTSEVISCRLGNWMPIFMMEFFNVFDLVGKILSSNTKGWTGWRLVKCSVARLVLIPLMLMCVVPRARPMLSSEVMAFTFSMILGFSNGILGSIPMIQAPSKVEDRHRELCGNMMTLLYMFGLTAGSMIAYVLEGALNPVPHTVCWTPAYYSNISRAMVHPETNSPIPPTTFSSAVSTFTTIWENTTDPV